MNIICVDVASGGLRIVAGHFQEWHKRPPRGVCVRDLLIHQQVPVPVWTADLTQPLPDAPMREETQAVTYAVAYDGPQEPTAEEVAAALNAIEWHHGSVRWSAP